MLRDMNRYLPAAALACAALLLTACSSTSSNQTPAASSTSACEHALVTEALAAIHSGTPAPSTTPTACAGLSAATMDTLGKQAYGEVFASMLPTPAPS